jgi:hypothetical protein
MSKPDYDSHVGLKAPPLGGYFQPLDFTKMRKEIFEAQRDSALIRACMQLADIEGLSGEDRYTYLAYRALIGFERQWQQLRQMWSLMPTQASSESEEVTE